MKKTAPQKKGGAAKKDKKGSHDSSAAAPPQSFQKKAVNLSLDMEAEVKALLKVSECAHNSKGTTSKTWWTVQGQCSLVSASAACLKH